MIINIKPVDVLFFRDSKPFSRGNEHFAKSVFPPLPQTLYGALRTKVMEELGCDFEKFKDGEYVFNNQRSISQIELENIKNKIGTVDKPGDFVLKGPILFHKDDAIYLKLPADVKEVNGEYKILQPFEWQNFGIESDLDGITNFPHIITEQPIKDKDGYISLRDFINYALCGRIREVKKSNDIFDYEFRTGIGINPETNVTKEGLLYTMGFIRLQKDWSLFAKIENLSALPESGVIKFGGANRVCEYNKIDSDPFGIYFTDEQQIKNIIQENKMFKLVLLTPAFFNNGWISDKFDSNLEMQKGNVKIRLISAVVDRPENISGWDIARKRAKPLRKLVPAGSVYYFELLEGTVDELFKEMNFVNFSDENPNLGFGLTLIGGVKK